MARKSVERRTVTPKGGSSLAIPVKQGAYGKTGADGRFRLQTYGVDDGAVPGDYDVTIQKVHITPDEFDRDDPRWKPPPPPKYLVPKKYSDRDKSRLAASVIKGQTNEFPFELQE